VKVAAKADVNILPVVTLGLILSLVVVLLDIGAVSDARYATSVVREDTE